MCRDCGCSLGPAATRAPFAAQPATKGHIESIEVAVRILGTKDADRAIQIQRRLAAKVHILMQQNIEDKSLGWG